MMAIKLAPKGWVLCNGRLLPINQNQALFSLLGTTFVGTGGGSRTTRSRTGAMPAFISSATTAARR
jgi:microcystin-dependent protein